MKVYTPSKNYMGISANMTSCNGTGETDDPRLLDWFRDHDYEVETPEPEAQESGAAKGPKKGTTKKISE